MKTPLQQGIFGRTDSKNKINELAVTSRGILFFPSLNNTTPSRPYRVVSKIKDLPEEKSNEKLPAGIGNNYSYSSLAIGDDLKIGDMSGGNMINRIWCYKF